MRLRRRGGTDEAYERAYVLGLRTLQEALSDQPRARWILISSTAVYAQNTGEWVDELSPTEPTAVTSRRILEGEALLASAPGLGTVLRLGGIYGPGRTSLIRRALQGELPAQPEPPTYSNRIYRDDCAGAICHLLDLEQPERVYVGVDHEPAELHAVLKFLRERAVASGSQLQLSADTASLSAQAKRARGRPSNKRCSNKRLLASGYTFQFPSFRQGYTSLLESECLRTSGSV